MVFRKLAGGLALLAAVFSCTKKNGRSAAELRHAYIISNAMMRHIGLAPARQVSGHPGELLVPSGAVISARDSSFVVAFRSQRDVALRPVEVAGDSAGVLFVHSGLKPGEAVVTQKKEEIFRALHP